VGVQEKEGAGMTRAFLTRSVLFTLLCLGWTSPLVAQDSHLLVVVGLGGDQDYRELFHGWAVDMISAAKDRFGIPADRIQYLGERPDDAPGVIDDRSTVENLGSVLAGMAGRSGPQDRILILLIGHGTGEGDEANFNLPGPDLSPADLAVMLQDLSSQSVAVVNTTPSSGPFVAGLSGPNRVVITATRTAQEKNETQFGGFFVAGLKEDGSDLNKDGRISLLEAFQYAQSEVVRYYESQNLLATEHALLDDDGDGEGSVELGEGSTDGLLAGSFWLGTAAGTATGSAVPDSITDPVLVRLYEEQAELERRVLEFTGLRGQMEESRYEAELEALLVELALKNREIREKGEGRSW
jgi:hypothetical protein